MFLEPTPSPKPIPPNPMSLLSPNQSRSASLEPFTELDQVQSQVGPTPVSSQLVQNHSWAPGSHIAGVASQPQLSCWENPPCAPPLVPPLVPPSPLCSAWLRPVSTILGPVRALACRETGSSFLICTTGSDQWDHSFDLLWHIQRNLKEGQHFFGKKSENDVLKMVQYS